MKRNNDKNKKISIFPILIVIFGFVFFITLGYKSNIELNNKEKTLLNNELQSDKNDILEFNKVENDVEMVEIPITKLSNDKIDLNVDWDKNTSLEEFTFTNSSEKNDSDIKNDVYVNKIIIAKNIDNDQTSDNYRNPIDAYKTISTLNKSIIKEVDYHPSFFIWTSINTEEKIFINEFGEFKPLRVNMNVKCNDILIDELEYNITSNTPRWREWIEIDVRNLNSNSLNQIWNVEIIDLENDLVLESRNFKLLNDNQILSMVETKENN